jgi:hypothetical protein
MMGEEEKRAESTPTGPPPVSERSAAKHPTRSANATDVEEAISKL